MNFFQFANYLDLGTEGPSGTPANSSPGGDPAELERLQSDAYLRFISRILLEEEDVEDTPCMLQGDPALVAAAEKPFLDILNGNSVLVSPDGPPLYLESLGSLDRNGGDLARRQEDPDAGVYENYPNFAGIANLDPGINGKEVAFSFDEIRTIWQFDKGAEEASKFLPDSSKLAFDVTGDGGSAAGMENDKNDEIAVESRGKKNLHDSVLDLDHDGRRTRQSTTYLDEDAPKELYDKVLLWNIGGDDCAESSQDESAEKSKGRKPAGEEVVDLRSLLISCAQSISAGNRRAASRQLLQIRLHSSVTGDGSQRLAHYFAEGLEARLAGTGSEAYRACIAARRSSAADRLKAHKLYTTALPFKKISHVFANQIILRVAENARTVHVIDFGIVFGFYMPSLVQAISKRPSGAPRFRFTAINFPEPGFRPCRRLEEIGRRLAEYAREFRVPFEYQHFAKKWEDVKIDDLNLREDELLVVTCMNLLENVADDSVSEECPRDLVLNNIRKMNPAVFIHGTVNSAYSPPFFATRFREALFHFSAVFDAFDCNTTREDPYRLILEREVFGPDILSVIACEGAERLHRPESYKQWQVRNRRCGFQQLPLDPEVVSICRDVIMSLRNKEFLLDTDGEWMVQGWKGRVLSAVSAWKPDG